MTRVEHIHTLIDEDKDALVSSYLSLLAYLKTHQDLQSDKDEFIAEINQSVNRHIEKLPEDSVEIFEELAQNEVKRLEEWGVL